MPQVFFEVDFTFKYPNFSRDPFIYNKKEITLLYTRNKMTIATLKNFDEYAKNYYASLQAHPHYKELASIIEPFLKEIIENGEFYVRVHTQKLKQILLSGKLKNALETSSSASFGGSKARKNSIEHLFNCNTEELKDSDYPRFGYLSCKDRRVNFFATADMGFQYGMTVIRLKKENLFNRTTISVGSTLDFCSYNFLVPSYLDNPKASCIVSFPNHPLQNMIMAPQNAVSFKNLEIIAKGIIDKKITADNFFKLDDLLGDIVPQFKYFELQFHGEINTDDFECIDTDELDPNVEKICNDLKINIEEMSL